VGMLVDLDLAKELNSGLSGARHRTGTMEFMAIEVLLGTARSYHHGLNSLFYALLWMIIKHGGKYLVNGGIPVMQDRRWNQDEPNSNLVYRITISMIMSFSFIHSQDSFLRGIQFFTA